MALFSFRFLKNGSDGSGSDFACCPVLPFLVFCCWKSKEHHHQQKKECLSLLNPKSLEKKGKTLKKETLARRKTRNSKKTRKGRITVSGEKKRFRRFRFPVPIRFLHHAVFLIVSPHWQALPTEGLFEDRFTSSSAFPGGLEGGTGGLVFKLLSGPLNRLNAILSLLHSLDCYRTPSAIGSAIGRPLSRPISHPITGGSPQPPRSKPLGRLNRERWWCYSV